MGTTFAPSYFRRLVRVTGHSFAVYVYRDARSRGTRSRGGGGVLLDFAPPFCMRDMRCRGAGVVGLKVSEAGSMYMAYRIEATLEGTGNWSGARIGKKLRIRLLSGEQKGCCPVDCDAVVHRRAIYRIWLSPATEAYRETPAGYATSITQTPITQFRNPTSSCQAIKCARTPPLLSTHSCPVRAPSSRARGPPVSLLTILHPPPRHNADS